MYIYNYVISSSFLYCNISDLDDRIPTQVFDDEWIYAYPDEDGPQGEPFGKWLVFRKYEDLNQTWELIKEQVRSGKLGASLANTSTMVKTETSGEDGVICVFTTKEDMDEVGLKLLKLIPDEEIRYKTNSATDRNIYIVYGARKATYKTLHRNGDGEPIFSFDKRYGKWIIQCTKHNVDSMYQSIRKAAEEGALGDVWGVEVYRDSDVANISVFTTEEDVYKVGYNISEMVKCNIRFKTTNLCAGELKRICLWWNQGSPYSEEYILSQNQ